MTELLIIKAGDDYYRSGDGGFEPCSMSKASVYTLGQVVDAKDICEKLKKTGVAARLMKLTIVEEPYAE